MQARSSSATWSCPLSIAPGGPRSAATWIAVVGQAPGLSGFLSARENVELGLALRGIEAGEATDRAADALAAVGLAAHAERRVDLLSAGQRERVALARVFAARTPVVIADEPTSRLDASTTVEIGTLLAELAHGTGTTVVCATHDPLLIGLADREVRLRETRADTIDVMASATIQVSGVRCERCIGRLAVALRGHDGIEYANANLMGEVALSWDEDKTSKDEIAATLRRSGFPEITNERE